MASQETLLIKNANIITMGETNQYIKGSIFVDNNTIVDINSSKTSADTIIDAKGKLIMPGLVCAHTHMYGAYARGMGLKGPPPANFPEILEKLWWNIDKKLTLEDVQTCAQICLMECIRSGTTSFAEHHASPFAVKGSLETIALEIYKSGLRGQVCYEVSDRDGEKSANEGLQENAQFISSHKDDPRVRGNFGLHASFTVGESTLGKAVSMEKHDNAGFHIHVAEDEADVRETMKICDRRVVERLYERGVLKPKTIAAHCIHITGREVQLLADSGCYVVHNPESNMNNGVGVAPVLDMLSKDIPVGLGTDGFTFDMFREAKVTYILHKLAHLDPRKMGADIVMNMLYKVNPEIVGFNTGEIVPGKLADILILDYKPPTPLNAGNFPWHFIFGLSTANIDTVIADGKIVLENRTIKTFDEDKVIKNAQTRSQQLWDRL